MTIRLNPRASLFATSCAALMLLAGCGGGSQPVTADKLDAKADLSKQALVVSNWADYMAKDTPENFTKASGVKVDVTTHATNEEIMAKLTGGNSGIDVAFVSGQFAEALAKQGLTEPIHPELIPNLKNLYPEASRLSYDVGNEYSVPYTWGTTGICYRADLVNPAPTSWKDLLAPRPELRGKVTMLKTDRWLMLPAQKLLGFSANTTNEAQLSKVKDTLVAAKSGLLAYDDTTFYERLVSGEASLVEAWDGWCNYGIAKNDNIKFVVPSEGSDLWADTMVILKSSKSKEAAHAFINYILEPKVHEWTVENILYNVPNQAAMAAVPQELRDQYPTLNVTPAELLKGESLVDLGNTTTLYTRYATEITASK